MSADKTKSGATRQAGKGGCAGLRHFIVLAGRICGLCHACHLQALREIGTFRRGAGLRGLAGAGALRLARSPGGRRGLAASENHFGALYGQSVDQQGTDVDAGGTEAVVVDDLVDSFLEFHGDPADDAAVDAGEEETGSAGKHIGAGVDRDERGFIKGIGPVGEQLDSIVTR